MKLIWFDLETTGLDSRRDDILEVAAAVADLNAPFAHSDVKSWVCIYRWAPWSWDPVVLDMHTRNGLLDAATGSCFYVNDVEKELLKMVPEDADRPVLAGNSVHFDLGFVRSTMPTLAKRLSHQVYDVSAVTLFCRSLGMPELHKEEEPHRAAADVYSSIQQARQCANWVAVHYHPWRQASL
jgi:oligoribonuclease